MKKDSIVKMLKTLKSKPTDVNVSIIQLLLSDKNLGVAKKPAVVDSLSKGSKPFPKRRVQTALRSLLKKGIVMETNVKGTVRVNLTHTAWIELVGAEAGKKAAQLLSEGEKVLKDVTALAKKEGGELKKKTLRKIAKGVDFLKDEFKKACKK